MYKSVKKFSSIIVVLSLSLLVQAIRAEETDDIDYQDFEAMPSEINRKKKICNLKVNNLCVRNKAAIQNLSVNTETVNTLVVPGSETVNNLTITGTTTFEGPIACPSSGSIAIPCNVNVAGNITFDGCTQNVIGSPCETYLSDVRGSVQISPDLTLTVGPGFSGITIGGTNAVNKLSGAGSCYSVSDISSATLKINASHLGFGLFALYQGLPIVSFDVSYSTPFATGTTPTVVASLGNLAANLTTLFGISGLNNLLITVLVSIDPTPSIPLNQGFRVSLIPLVLGDLVTSPASLTTILNNIIPGLVINFIAQDTATTSTASC